MPAYAPPPDYYYGYPYAYPYYAYPYGYPYYYYPRPVYVVPAPVYAAPPPGYAQPAPGYAPPAPAYYPPAATAPQQPSQFAQSAVFDRRAAAESRAEPPGPAAPAAKPGEPQPARWDGIVIGERGPPSFPDRCSPYGCASKFSRTGRLPAFSASAISAASCLVNLPVILHLLDVTSRMTGAVQSSPSMMIPSRYET